MGRGHGCWKKASKGGDRYLAQPQNRTRVQVDKRVHPSWAASDVVEAPAYPPGNWSTRITGPDAWLAFGSSYTHTHTHTHF